MSTPAEIAARYAAVAKRLEALEASRKRRARGQAEPMTREEEVALLERRVQLLEEEETQARWRNR